MKNDVFNEKTKKAILIALACYVMALIGFAVMHFFSVTIGVIIAAISVPLGAFYTFYAATHMKRAEFAPKRNAK